MRKLVSEKNAHWIAAFLQVICYFMVFFAVVSIVLILLGRVELSLTTPSGHYDNALFLEKDHSVTSRILLASLVNQNIFLNTVNSNGSVDFITWLGISLIGIIKVLPFGFCFFLFSKFFANISNGKVFVTRNANIMRTSGLVLIAASLLTRTLTDSLIPSMVNQLSANHLIVSSASADFTGLLLGAGLLVMAYVFHYGIYLQDEADHTL